VSKDSDLRDVPPEVMESDLRIELESIRTALVNSDIGRRGYVREFRSQESRLQECIGIEMREAGR
jgi:hypothetical protein